MIEKENNCHIIMVSTKNNNNINNINNNINNNSTTNGSSASGTVISHTNGTNISNMSSGSESAGVIKDNNEKESSAAAETQGEVDIILNNVVCNFSVRCHLNLKQIAQTGYNVEYHKAMAMLIMKFRRPRCTASIWSSGKVTMTGATTESDAKIGARRCARTLQKLGFNVKFTNYRIVNVLATCTMPFAIKIAEFASAHPRLASYEPELHPGVTYKMKDVRATLKIFSTGSITITAPKVETVQAAVEEAYRLVYEFRNERRPGDLQHHPISMRRKRRIREASEDEDDNEGGSNLYTTSGGGGGGRKRSRNNQGSP